MPSGRSRQFQHLQEASLQRLRARIPHDCPLLVERREAGGFRACTLDGADDIHGRFEVVHAFIDGYVCCWRRLPPPEHFVELLAKLD